MTLFRDFHFTFAGPLQLEYVDFGSVRGRIFSLIAFFKIIISLPFVLLIRSVKTLLKVTGLFFSLVALVLCLAMSEGVRSFFLSRLMALAQEIGAWIVLPFTLVVGLLRAFFGFLIHPALYFTAY